MADHIGLTFDVLRQANKQRCPHFHDGEGVEAWMLSQWSNALAGEVGESANLIKKFERGDFREHFDDDDFGDVLAGELADIAIYLDLLAERAGVNLGEAIIEKFNSVSDRVSSRVKIEPTTLRTSVCIHTVGTYSDDALPGGFGAMSWPERDPKAVERDRLHLAPVREQTP